MTAEKEERTFSPLKAAVGRVSQQMASAKKIKIQRVSVAMEDAEALVSFAKAAQQELGAKTRTGTINALPYQSLDWLGNDEQLVERFLTPWKDVEE